MAQRMCVHRPAPQEKGQEMSATNDGGPAFPRPCGEYDDASLSGGAYNNSQSGMSLRDWFAGQALAGLAACPNLKRTDNASVVAACYGVADAMLAERAKR